MVHLLHPITYSSRSVVMHCTKNIIIAGLLCVSLSADPALSATTDIAQIPLHLGGQVKPNIMFLLDDSGSMQWEVLPDELYGMYYTYWTYPQVTGIYGGSSYSNWVATPIDHIYSAMYRSAALNKVYYDPEITYEPWKKADGTTYPNATPSAAYHNPEITSAGTRNLTAENAAPSGGWDVCTPDAAGSATFNGVTFSCTTSSTPRKFWPAFYYRYNGGDITSLASYTRVEIRPETSTYTGGPNRTDCVAAPTCTYAEEIQNFANWYTYYRSRILAARAGVGAAFAQIPEAADDESVPRVGFGAINKESTTIDGINTSTIISGVRPFRSTNRQAFFDTLYGHVIPADWTPLHRALDDAGKYYQRSGDLSPWNKTPGVSDGADDISCRQSYTILTTDGYWNSSAATTAAARENVDGTAGPTIIGPNGKIYTYNAVSPFSDNWSNTLADVAMYYWKNDLHPGLVNDVPSNPLDPAFWQHMVTLGVSLGISGTINKQDAFNAITSGATINWPQPYSGATSANLDDLLHAAVNSRGDFFAAQNPQEFAAGLIGTLNTISSRTSSSAAIATNSTRLDTNTLIYQAKYDSSDWSGHLLAFSLNADGSVGSQAWDAATKLPNHSSRNIFTHNGTGGLEFKDTQWTNLSATQRTALGDTSILNYLRGDQSNEIQNGGTYRNRSYLLGDIINSDPWYVGRTNFGYSTLPETEGDTYVDFINSTTVKNRSTIVYVGANDGMLHAFDAVTGVEKFAYVPASIYSNLASLAMPTYTHKFFVDGSPRAGDAYIDTGTGTRWHTVLVGSTGAGGKSIFALNVTTPDTFEAKDVLWEFTHAELGTTIGQPTIARLENGMWVAIFGNGYNSTSQKAQLFIVNLATGAPIKVIDTGVGNTATPNGLATPIAVDSDGNRSVDVIYAGDLQGNMWRFDVDADNVSQWGIPYKQGGTPKPLFTAIGPDGLVQAITAKPQVGANSKGGLTVYFGTGKYFSTGDNVIPASPQVHTFYGIEDNGVRVTSRAGLLQQEITYEATHTFDGNSYDVRIVSDNQITTSHSGWYIDLIKPVGIKQGERVISAPLLWADRIIFATMIPDSNPCAYGGTSWLMEVDPTDGSRLDFSPFDLNHDGLFNSDDYVIDPSTGQPVAVAGRKSKEGIIKTPGVIHAEGASYKYTSGSTGNIEVTVNKGATGTGRQSWQQLR